MLTADCFFCKSFAAASPTFLYPVRKESFDFNVSKLLSDARFQGVNLRECNLGSNIFGEDFF